jgi:hypothetical protein
VLREHQVAVCNYVEDAGIAADELGFDAQLLGE